MCEQTTTIKVKRAVLNRYKWEEDREVDSCIADLAQALENAGIEVKGSCCRHGDGFGVIILRDGRFLSVCDKANFQSLRWAFRLAWQIVRNRYWLEFKQWMG